MRNSNKEIEDALGEVCKMLKPGLAEALMKGVREGKSYSQKPKSLMSKILDKIK